MNEGIALEKKWDEAAIQRRAHKLADKALNVWPMIEVSEDKFEIYNIKNHQVTKYSITDHPYLVKGNIAELYQAFRQAVLALDPCVTEQFKKRYVTFKAETNLVDIIPQAKRLLLSINMPFTEINDSRGCCRDVTHFRRCTNGDVEVGLNDIDDIPYIITLVSQALERQISGD